jgi:hypothetical protein
MSGAACGAPSFASMTMKAAPLGVKGAVLRRGRIAAPADSKAEDGETGAPLPNNAPAGFLSG